MSKRNFKNFFDAFMEYSDDNFVPKNFNWWACASIVAGALERKVWLPWGKSTMYYPNMYIFLVSLPGVGKSTALNRAVDLLFPLYQQKGSITFMPNQASEAKLIAMMAEKNQFQYGSMVMFHCSGYYYASEASNSIKEVYGDITSTMTDFYDCPPLWRKATQKDGVVKLENVCFNLLAGSTFDYLGKLITDENILGGFASRITYVVCPTRELKKQTWQHQSMADDTKRFEFRQKLVEDLSQINDMIGPFRADEGYARAWEEWNGGFLEFMQSVSSEKMQSLLTRTDTSVKKLSMILSAAESEDRILKKHHLEKAVAMLKETQDTLPELFRNSRASNTQTQDGLNNALYQAFANKPEGMSEPGLKLHLMNKGFPGPTVDMTIQYMITNGALRRATVNGVGNLQLIINPDDNF